MATEPLENDFKSDKAFNSVKSLTVIGKAGCGKTSIFNRFFRNKFLNKITTTPVTNEYLTFRKYGKKMLLRIYDTSGQESFAHFRSLTIPISEYVMIVYAIDDHSSFNEITDTLVPLIMEKGPKNVKIILVATKKDLRTKEDKTTEEGAYLARCIDAIKFYEVSSLTGSGMEDLFDELKDEVYRSSYPGIVNWFVNVFYCIFSCSY